MIILTKVDHRVVVPSVHRKISPQAKIVLKSTLRPRETDRLKGLRVVAFCGIGDPDSFESTLTQMGADIVEFQTFRDHYAYDERDMNRLRKLLEKENADALATTEKDWVKLPGSEKEKGLIVPIPVDVTWLNEGESRLKEALQRLF
jgi:tetraacyldisaccharide 4'-kinase